MTTVDALSLVAAASVVGAPLVAYLDRLRRRALMPRRDRSVCVCVCVCTIGEHAALIATICTDDRKLFNTLCSVFAAAWFASVPDEDDVPQDWRLETSPQPQ
jgi:hypothetical protein